MGCGASKIPGEGAIPFTPPPISTNSVKFTPGDPLKGSPNSSPQRKAPAALNALKKAPSLRDGSPGQSPTRSPLRLSEDTKEDREKAQASVRISRSKSLKPEGTTDNNAKLVQLSTTSPKFGKLPPLSPHRARGINEHTRPNPNPTLGLGVGLFQDRRKSLEDDTRRRSSSHSSNSRQKILQEREDSLTKNAKRGTSNISAESKAAENRAVQRAIDLRRSRESSKEVIEADEKKKESLLMVTCSPNGAISTSNALARYFAEAFEEAFPEQTVTVLDLADADLFPPMADIASGPASEGLALVKQFATHSKFLFAMPMWNLTVPSSLKQYFDLLLHPAHGHLRDKAKGWNTTDCPVTMLATCGNSQLGGEQDFLTPYVNDIFQKLGFRDIRDPVLVNGSYAERDLPKLLDNAYRMARLQAVNFEFDVSFEMYSTNAPRKKYAVAPEGERLALGPKLLVVKAAQTSEDSTCTDAVASQFSERHLSEAQVDTCLDQAPSVDTIDVSSLGLTHFSRCNTESQFLLWTEVLCIDESSEDDLPAMGSEWVQVERVVEPFVRADCYLFVVPVAQFFVPFHLKQYLDHVLQPVLTYNPRKKIPLFTQKIVCVCTTSAGPLNYGGADMLTAYLKAVFAGVGFVDIRTAHVDTSVSGTAGVMAAVDKLSPPLSTLAPPRPPSGSVLDPNDPFSQPPTSSPPPELAQYPSSPDLTPVNKEKSLDEESTAREERLRQVSPADLEVMEVLDEELEEVIKDEERLDPAGRIDPTAPPNGSIDPTISPNHVGPRLNPTAEMARISGRTTWVEPLDSDDEHSRSRRSILSTQDSVLSTLSQKGSVPEPMEQCSDQRSSNAPEPASGAEARRNKTSLDGLRMSPTSPLTRVDYPQYQFQDLFHQNWQNVPTLPIELLDPILESHLARAWTLPASNATRTAHVAAVQQLQEEFHGVELWNEANEMQANSQSYPANHTQDLADHECFKRRDTMVACQNSSYLGLDCSTNKNTSTLTLAARFMHLFAAWKNLASKGVLEADTHGEEWEPLCAAMVPRMFGCCQVPGEEVDQLVCNPESRHMVVMWHGHIFSVDVINAIGQVVEYDVLQAQLESIIHQTSDRERFPLCALTSLPRTEWARHRKDLLRSNKEAEALLEVVESAVLVVCLDEKVGADAHGRELLCGPVANRWWDKHQLVAEVGGEGMGLVFARHTPDPNTWVQLLQDLMSEVLYLDEFPVCSPLTAPDTPKKILFTLTEDLRKGVNDAMRKYQKLVSLIDHCPSVFYDVGIKQSEQWGCKPETVLSLSIQLAHYHLCGEVVPAAIRVSQRHFFNASEDLMSLNRPYIHKVMKVMTQLDSLSDDPTRHSECQRSFMSALKSAATALEKDQLAAHHSAEGLESLLRSMEVHCMRQMAADPSMEPPKLFNDPLYKRNTKWKLLLANASAYARPSMPMKNFNAFGVGLVNDPAENSFHISFLVQEYHTVLGVTSHVEPGPCTSHHSSAKVVAAIKEMLGLVINVVRM